MLTKEEEEIIIDTLSREPTTAEKALLDALWSEHCSYKSSKRWFHLFNKESELVYLGIGEGAGLVDVGDDYVIGLGMESHNHPSAIDPFNGAATGVGGIIRDILSQGCRPVAVLDCLRFAEPDTPRQKLLLDQVTLGISSYGNCVGVPNLGGDLEFAPEFTGNPLINAMCVGVAKKQDIIRSVAKNPGDKLLLFGAATGRDGIGGVTFASEELTDEQNESRGSIQIGDPLTEKILIDAVLEMRDQKLLNGLQDLGGGGLVCAATEMAEKGGTGVLLELQKVPLKAENMHGWEILVSESQERMLAVVSPDKLSGAIKILDNFELPWAVIGEITDTGYLESKLGDKTETKINIDFVINGFPEPEREIGEIIINEKTPLYSDSILNENINTDANITHNEEDEYKFLDDVDPLIEMLDSIYLSSRKPVYQQYDQHVQGNTVIPPGMDAGVIYLPNGKYLALSAGTNSYMVSRNPYMGSILATLSEIRSVIARGATPIAMVDSLNAGNPENPNSYAEFVDIIKGVAEVSHDMNIPVVGGNVSLYNESEVNGEIHKILSSPFVGIAGIIDHEPIPDKLQGNNIIVYLAPDNVFLIGSEYHRIFGGKPGTMYVDFDVEKSMASFIQKNWEQIKSATDIGRGGLITTLAKWAIYSNKGIVIDVDLSTEHNWGEAGGYILEIEDISVLEQSELTYYIIGKSTKETKFEFDGKIYELKYLREIWERNMRWALWA